MEINNNIPSNEINNLDTNIDGLSINLYKHQKIIIQRKYQQNYSK